MRRHHLLTYALPVMALAGLGLAAYDANAINPGNPATYPATATVQILQLISIAQTSALDFGTITAPSLGNGPSTFSVSNVGTVSVLGGDGAVINPSGSAGVYPITGSVGTAYTLTLTPGICTGAGLTLGNMQSDWLVGNTLNDTVTVTADLAVTDAAVAGGPTCPYDVKAEY